MKKIAVTVLLLAFFGCQKASENPPANVTAQNSVVRSSSETNQTLREQSAVDIFNLVGKSPSEIDAILGKSIDSKQFEEDKMAGEYRLYQLENHPKGLAVRFFQNKAASFNLLLTENFATSQEAILNSFGIDVGKSLPVKDEDEPLTERYQGNFNGINFSKISAKKRDDGNGFIFVLAEVGR